MAILKLKGNKKAYLFGKIIAAAIALCGMIAIEKFEYHTVGMVLIVIGILMGLLLVYHQQ